MISNGASRFFCNSISFPPAINFALSLIIQHCSSLASINIVTSGHLQVERSSVICFLHRDFERCDSLSLLCKTNLPRVTYRVLACVPVPHEREHEEYEFQLLTTQFRAQHLLRLLLRRQPSQFSSKKQKRKQKSTQHLISIIAAVL